MRTFWVILILIVFAAAGGSAWAQEPTVQDRPVKLTREERRRERERLLTEKATAQTADEVRSGRHPNYNRLLKSTNYDLMYTEGLRYYGLRKAGKDYNSQMNYSKAQKLLDAAVQSQVFTGTRREDSLQFFLGSSFYKAGDFTVSEQIFDNFRRRYTSSPMVEDAEYMYAMGFYFLSPPPEFDQSTTLRAMSAIREYEGRYPNTVKKEECDTRLAELQGKLYTKSFENAKLYYSIRQYKAAVRALRNAVDQFPESPYREEMMYLLTRSAYLFAKNSIASQQTDRYMAMMDNYFDLVSEFPDNENRREVDRMNTEAKEYLDKTTNGNKNGK